MKEILKTLLYEWRARKLPSTIKRDVQLDTLPQKGGNNATVITGFRRVGKTYLLFSAIEKLLRSHSREEVVYINFEDERIMTPTVELLTNLIPEIEALYGHKPKFLFLDELQLIPNWSKWVRRILDTENIQIFITGSSSKMGSAELPTELRGRFWEIKVNPLTFKEFLRFKSTSIDFEKLAFVKSELARFRFLFDEYLIYGGLPAVVLSPPEKKLELLQSYFGSVVQRDIAERYEIDNDMALKTLLKLLLNSTYITISKLTNSLKSLGIPIGKSTVINYLSYIQSSYFTNELFIYNSKIINQLQYPRKIYFTDTGFITALSTKFSKNMGRLLENIVFQKLCQQNDTVYYYKDSKNLEVDFVIMTEEKVTALYQVCFDLTDEETQNREIKSLIKAGKALNCKNLILLTMENISFPKLSKEIKLVSMPEFLQ
jgi:predicted AAA+ superfamily ATPase